MDSLLWNLFYKGNIEEVRAALGRGEDVNCLNRIQLVQTGLMLAVINKHNSIVKLLLEQPTVDLNLTDHQGYTALHYAANHNNVEAVQLLLADSRFHSVNLKDSHGKTPVMNAMFYKKNGALRELVANPSVDLDTRDGKGRSLEEVSRWALNNLNRFSDFLVCCRIRRGFPDGERIVFEARQERRLKAADFQVKC